MEFSGFDWDDGNYAKCQRHGVSIDVIEGLFDRAVAIFPDAHHSRSEPRYRAIGTTREGRAVFVVFTLRHRGDDVRVRPISARYMHQKEVRAFEKENPQLRD
jgi:uncharacterized DUF497 family protein